MAKKKKASSTKVKSSTVEKKKPAPAAAPHPKLKDGKEGKEGKAEKKAPPVNDVKAEKGRKNGKAAAQGLTNASDDGQKLTRLMLIKARHEAMRREIDQIREDLESDEEE